MFLKDRIFYIRCCLRILSRAHLKETQQSLDLYSCRNFNLFVYLHVTSVTLQIAESLMQALKLKNDKNETESVNQI